MNEKKNESEILKKDKPTHISDPEQNIAFAIARKKNKNIKYVHQTEISDDINQAKYSSRAGKV